MNINNHKLCTFQILVTEIDDIVERVSDTCLENKTDDTEENARPISRFKANRNRSNNSKQNIIYAYIYFFYLVSLSS